MSKPEAIRIDEVEYVRKDSIKTSAKTLNDMKYVIIRTYSAGVHAGYLKSRNGKEVELINARRLWKWVGAASLSQLSVDGVSNPAECKFPCEVSSIELTECIEVIPCTEKARISIKEVVVWEA